MHVPTNIFFPNCCNRDSSLDWIVLRSVKVHTTYFSTDALTSAVLSCTFRKQQEHSMAQSHHSSGKPLQAIDVAVLSCTLRTTLRGPIGFLALRSLRVMSPVEILTRGDELLRIVCVGSSWRLGGRHEPVQT